MITKQNIETEYCNDMGYSYFNNYNNNDYTKHLEKKLIEASTMHSVNKRYDARKYTPPFRVGRKQGKSVLDVKGIEVAFFMHSEEQAKMYCDYLNLSS
jgi:hypothetical protein